MMAINKNLRDLNYLLEHIWKFENKWIINRKLKKHVTESKKLTNT